MGNLCGLTFYLAAVALLLLVGAGQITFASENRSGPIRLMLVAVQMLIVGWFIIRRDLRPLEQVTGTAERIARGDLTLRVGMPEDGSEIGRLGHAFDAMLDQIQAAFASQQAALSAKEASETMLRQFVADASHELRTPLTTLRGYAELHRAGGLEERSELEQAMARIGSESRRMATLVEDLLLLARLDQGRPLRRDPVALSTLVEDALRDMRALEPERPVTAEVEPALTVVGDEDRLRQVIGNLFANVRVHTPSATPVGNGKWIRAKSFITRSTSATRRSSRPGIRNMIGSTGLLPWVWGGASRRRRCMTCTRSSRILGVRGQ